MHKEQIKHRAQTCTKHKLITWFVICVLGFVSFYPQVARADPHAMFYTAIGQQQLFYNVLAALDQADYVETQYAREQLVEERAGEQAEPPFRDEKFPLTEATKVGQETTSLTDPGIADVLSRLITLEGTDLYNDQLVREFGAESGRRNSTSELLRTLCDYGLGFKDCEFDTTGRNPAEIAKYRDWAIVKDPIEWNNLPFTHGVLGALSSGASGSTTGIIKWGDSYRQQLWTDPDERRLPYAYSRDIARWRAEIAAKDEKTRNYLMPIFEQMLVNTANSYVTEDVESPYNNITSDSQGNLVYYVPGGGQPSAADLTKAATSVLSLAPKIEEIAAEAAARIVAQQEIVEDEGLLADATLKSHPAPEPLIPPTNIGGSGTGELSWLIENPVAVKKADVYSLPNALALLDTSQQASSLAGLDKPGSQQLVERGSGSGTSGQTCNCVSPGDLDYDPSLPMCQAGQCQVQGLQTTAETGQVLGKLNLFSLPGYEKFDAEKEPTSPSANLIAGHLEQGAVHALRVLTAGKFRETSGVRRCGYTCYY